MSFKLTLEHEIAAPPAERCRTMGTLKLPSGQVQCFCESRSSWNDADAAVIVRAKEFAAQFRASLVPATVEVEI